MRRPFDHYPTDVALTEHLLKHVPVSGLVLELCAGEGKMAAVLRRHPPILDVVTNDINPDWPGLDFVGDARLEDSAVWQENLRPHWVITNPPFSSAMEILQHSWEQCRTGVAFLLRVTFLEPTGTRADWLACHADHLCHYLVFGSPRPGFTADGNTDSATVAWMVWRKDFSWKRLGVQPPFQFLSRWKN